MITLIANVGQLVTPVGGEPVQGQRMGTLSIRENVCVSVRGERIVAVSDTPPSEAADIVVDAGGGVVIPGLIDPLVWACQPTADTADPFSDDRRAASAFAQLLRHGTTSAEVRTPPVAGWKEAEDVLATVEMGARRSGIRLLSCFLGSPRAESRRSDDRISDLIGETIPGLQRHRLVGCCAALCGDNAYNRKEAKAVLRAAHGAGLGVKVQVSGTGGEAILLASELEATTIDQLVQASRPELERLRQTDVIPVLLPGEPFLPELPWGDARGMVDAGLAVALASGASASAAGILSMATVLSLAVRAMHLSVAEALTAATLNAAGALNLAHQVGTIEPGKQADLVVLDLRDFREIADIVVGHPVRCVVIGGRVAWRS